MLGVVSYYREIVTVSGRFFPIFDFKMSWPWHPGQRYSTCT